MSLYGFMSLKGTCTMFKHILIKANILVFTTIIFKEVLLSSWYISKWGSLQSLLGTVSHFQCIQINQTTIFYNHPTFINGSHLAYLELTSKLTTNRTNIQLEKRTTFHHYEDKTFSLQSICDCYNFPTHDLLNH